MEDTPLLVERRGATALVTLNRPRQRNALDLHLREALAGTVPELRDDDAVRAVVITGAGGHFCAGADVSLLAEAQAGTRDVFEGRARLRRMRPWMEEFIDLPKPVIAAVDGHAAGAGLSIALAADFVLATPRARFSAVFGRIGYVPDMGSMYLLPRLVGLQRAKELVYTACIVEAAEAQAMGLVHALHEPDRLLDEALALAARFERASAGALAIAKQTLNHAFETDRRTVFEIEALAQAVCRESGFHREAVTRFVAKQPPLYDWGGA